MSNTYVFLYIDINCLHYLYTVYCIVVFFFQILLCVEMLRATCGSISPQTLIHGAAGNLYVAPTHMEKQFSKLML